jgi:hypothetical protein
MLGRKGRDQLELFICVPSAPSQKVMTISYPTPTTGIDTVSRT